MAKTLRISACSLKRVATDMKLDALYREMPTIVSMDWLVDHTKPSTGICGRSESWYPHAPSKFRTTNIRFA